MLLFYAMSELRSCSLEKKNQFEISFAGVTNWDHRRQNDKRKREKDTDLRDIETDNKQNLYKILT